MPSSSLTFFCRPFSRLRSKPVIRIRITPADSKISVNIGSMVINTLTAATIFVSMEETLGNVVRIPSLIVRTSLFSRFISSPLW